MRPRSRFAFAGSALSTLLIACAARGAAESAGQGARDQGPPPAWAAPPLERALAVCDGSTGEPLSFGALLDRLARADAVFLGETHIDETTHRVELAVYEGLLARRDGRVVLAMEMFERDVQPHLDAYLAGAIDEARFLSLARPWANYRAAYRPLIERARTEGLPVVASNFPLGLRRRIAMEGPQVLERLEGDERRQAPAELIPETPATWRRVDNAVRGHVGMMGGPPDPGDPRLYDTQSLWDNSMGEACARALDEHPGAVVLHVNGGFHSEYHDGTVHQFRARKPQAEVLTVSILPAMNPATERLFGAPHADYVVFAEARASDLNDGMHSVWTSRELRYELHLPDGAAADAPLPLLVWLSDDGFTTKDGMALWKSRLGAECAIAVIEAPYRETQDDLVEGGRWFWPDTFAGDLDALTTGIEKAWGYLLRRYPLDPARVCLAGEGAGATVVAACAVHSERMGLSALALFPRRYAKIKDLPLPLPELYGDEPRPARSLRILVEAADEGWWTDEVGEYVTAGIDATLARGGEDPWLAEPERENSLREALGLAERPAPAAGRRHFVADGRRARHWARLAALRVAREEDAALAVLAREPDEADSTPLGLDVRPDGFADGAALPRCPGPFGGTTVLVLPAGAAPDEAAAWRALAEADPLAAHSRFHRLRLAEAEGERDLQAVLAGLLGENRKNVLIVPATFCADGATMRALRRRVRDLEDRMTLFWRPGLGGLEGEGRPD